MDGSVLRDIGLRESEIAVYLSLVELGPALSGRVIEKTALQSSVVHRALLTLISKGLVAFTLVGKNKQYHATDPQSLLNFIDQKRNNVEQLLPRLRRLQQNHTSTEVEMYVGKTAVFRLLNDVIVNGKKGDLYLSFSLVNEHKDPDVVRFYTIHNPRRKQLGLEVRVLANKAVKSIYEKTYARSILRNARIRYSTFHFPQGIVIFNDTVVLINWGEQPSAVRILSASTAEQFRNFFLELYDREEDAY